MVQSSLVTLFVAPLQMFTECSPNVHRMFTECSPNVHWMFTECSLNVHWMFTECSLNVHWMFTDWSNGALSAKRQLQLRRGALSFHSKEATKGWGTPYYYDYYYCYIIKHACAGAPMSLLCYVYIDELWYVTIRVCLYVLIWVMICVHICVEGLGFHGFMVYWFAVLCRLIIVSLYRFKVIWRYIDAHVVDNKVGHLLIVFLFRGGQVFLFIYRWI
jgi:hypothetical protein